MDQLLVFLFGAAVCVGVFLILRSMMLWYWKVDDILENQFLANKLLKSNNDLLKEQVTLLRQQIELTIGTDDSQEDDETKTQP